MTHLHVTFWEREAQKLCDEWWPMTSVTLRALDEKIYLILTKHLHLSELPLTWKDAFLQSPNTVGRQVHCRLSLVLYLLIDNFEAPSGVLIGFIDVTWWVCLKIFQEHLSPWSLHPVNRLLAQKLNRWQMNSLYGRGMGSWNPWGLWGDLFFYIMSHSLCGSLSPAVCLDCFIVGGTTS